MNNQKPRKDSYIMDFNLMRSKNYHLVTNAENQMIIPYFENLENHLIAYIEKSAYVIGCVAWLTNRNIIEALENSKGGSKIIVNKEEYLNSDMESARKFYYQCLRGRYNEIPDLFAINCHCCQIAVLQCPNFNKIFGSNIVNKAGAILACGIVNNFSKMHHKFLIFFDDKFEPTGVWTGSYNLSKTSNFSLENALYIRDQNVIMAYIREFLALYPYSEPYNWKSGALVAPIKN